MTVVDLKERLMDRDIYSYSGLPTKDMCADMMTKEMKLPSSLEDVIMKIVMDLSKLLVIEVKAVGTNIRNR